jgi:hypothetical protein
MRCRKASMTMITPMRPSGSFPNGRRRRAGTAIKNPRLSALIEAKYPSPRTGLPRSSGDAPAILIF